MIKGGRVSVLTTRSSGCHLVVNRVIPVSVNGPTHGIVIQVKNFRAQLKYHLFFVLHIQWNCQYCQFYIQNVSGSICFFLFFPLATSVIKAKTLSCLSYCNNLLSRFLLSFLSTIMTFPCKNQSDLFKNISQIMSFFTFRSLQLPTLWGKVNLSSLFWLTRTCIIWSLPNSPHHIVSLSPSSAFI